MVNIVPKHWIVKPPREAVAAKAPAVTLLMSRADCEWSAACLIEVLGR